MTGVTLTLAQDPEADLLLAESPFALLLGMLLDQQIPMEVAFAGPRKIADRLGGIDPHRILECDPERFTALCSETPAVHRFPGAMSKRIQEPQGCGPRATPMAPRCCGD